MERFRHVGFVSEFGSEMIPTKELEVFRGSPAGAAHGMAWTTSVRVARSFAKRYTDYPFSDDAGPGLVWRATVSPEAVLALIYQRDELEVVVDPAGLGELSRE